MPIFTVLHSNMQKIVRAFGLWSLMGKGFLTRDLTLLAFSDQTLLQMLKYGFLTSGRPKCLFSFFRNLFLEFGVKALGLSPGEILATPAAKFHSQGDKEDEDLLFKSRFLAFSENTWKVHTSALRELVVFCRKRDVNPILCPNKLLNLFLLHSAQEGKSFSWTQKVLSAVSFFKRFFLISDGSTDATVLNVKRFLEKACTVRSNKKDAFGSSEVRQIWDKIDRNGGVEKLNNFELRSFVMAVFQHKTFCRFSDAANLKLNDILFHDDYFKVHIRYSKTDQKGEGQEVYLTRNTSSSRNAHSLMCLFLHRVHSDPSDEVYLFPPLK